MLQSRVSHILQALSLVSTSELQQSASSMLFFCSVFHFPIHVPAAAAFCLLNVYLPVGAIHCHEFTTFLLAPYPARNNLLTPTLLSSRFFFRSQLLDSRSQVHSKRFHTICHRHTFFFAALTQLVLQEAARRNHLTLSFPFSLTDNLRPLFSTSSF